MVLIRNFIIVSISIQGSSPLILRGGKGIWDVVKAQKPVICATIFKSNVMWTCQVE